MGAYMSADSCVSAAAKAMSSIFPMAQSNRPCHSHSGTRGLRLAMCFGLCPSNRFMRAFSAGREIRPVRAAGHIDPLPNERFPKEEQVSSALILVGAAGMVASVLIASRISSGWILFWLAFAAVLGFGIGARRRA